MKTTKTNSQMSLLEYRHLALMALWAGLIAIVGVVFAFIPNIELVTISAFLGGVALGPRRGLIVAVIGEGIFSAFNPIGSGLGFPLLFLFQIISIGFSGWLGGIVSPMIRSIQKPALISAILGVIGFIITLIYDLLTTLSFPLSTGMTEGTLMGSISLGIVFFITHMISNTLLFASFGPVLIQLVNRQLIMHGLERN